MGEVLDERVEVERPAAPQRVVLVLPVVAQQAAVDDAQHGGGALPALDEVLESHEAAVLGGGGPGGQALAGLVGGDQRVLAVAADLHRGGAALARVQLVAAHEPGVDARSGGDRRPDLVRARRQHRLQLDLERVGHRAFSCPDPAAGAASGVSSGAESVSGATGVAGAAGIWCRPTTTR